MPRALRDVQSPKAIHDVVPNARIIMILRDPVERSFSHDKNRKFYHLMIQSTRTTKGQIRDTLFLISTSELGLYGEQLRRYLDTFGPKNVKILLFEEFIKDTQATVSDVLEFLGLGPSVPSNIETVYRSLFKSHKTYKNG